MNLGLFLSIGDSFTDMAKYGQDVKFKKLYLNFFANSFEKIYVFSYADEKVNDLPKNVILVGNRFKLHRYLYALVLPFVNYKYLTRCDVFRSYHLLGTVPAIITKVFFNKNFTYNFAFDYFSFSLIDKKYFQYFLLQILKPIANLLASLIIVANKDCLKYIPRKRSQYIPNGVDCKLFRPLKTTVRGNTILSIGRLEAQKNYLNLIKGISGLDIKVILIGKGSLKKPITETAEKFNVDLKINQPVKNAELPLIYNKSLIFVLPSIIEGSPKVLLEAMACGLPVIGSDVSGINDVIKDKENGLLTKTDPGSINKALTKLLQSTKLRKKLGTNSRKFILKNFSLDEILKKEVKAMKSVYD